jgi:hypothetical protein
VRRALILTGSGVLLLIVLAAMKIVEVRFGWLDSPRRNLSVGVIAGAGFLKLADWLGWLDEAGENLSLTTRGHDKPK